MGLCKDLYIKLIIEDLEVRVRWMKVYGKELN